MSSSILPFILVSPLGGDAVAPPPPPPATETVQIREYDTAAGTDRTGQAIRFHAKNTTSSLLVNPPILSASGYTYTYEKWFRLYFDGTSTKSLANARFYWDGAFADPEVRLAVRVADTYEMPTRPSDGAFPPDGFEDAEAFNGAASPLVVQPGIFLPVGGSGAGTQSYLVVVIGMSTDTNVAAHPSFSGSYLWDEAP